MGLDITAYGSGVTALPPDDNREPDWETTVRVTTHDWAPRSCRGLLIIQPALTS